MLARWLGTAAMALLSGGACLVAGCGSFGAATTGGDPNGVGTGDESGTDAGSGTEGSDGGGTGSDGGGGTDGHPTSSVALVGDWKFGLQVTIPPGANRLLLVTVHIEDSDDNGDGAGVRSMLLGQQQLARAQKGGRTVFAQSGKQQVIELWYLNEAGLEGTSDGFVSVELSRQPNEPAAFTHAFFSGVDQTEPFGQNAESRASGKGPVPVGPVFVPKHGVAIGACGVSESMPVKSPDATRGVDFRAESHAGATAWARGADANLWMTFTLDDPAPRRVASLVVLNPAR